MNGASGRHLSRRGFLIGAGLTGGAVVLSNPASLLAKVLSTQPADNFARKVLGKTGLKVSVVGFGAIRIRPGAGTRVLRMAIDAGINVLHTSHGYGGGRSVRAIAQLFKQDKSYRDKVVLCFKTGWDADESYLDRYLKMFGTDHADLYLPQLHWPDKRRMETALKNLERLKKKGKIRFGGFTCHSQMNEVCEMVLAEAPDGYDACLISTAMLRPRGDKVAANEQAKRFAANLAKLRKHGVGIISMKSGARAVIDKGPTEFASHVRALVGAGVDTVLTSFSSIAQVENAVKAGLKRIEPSHADLGRWQRQWAELGWACLMCGACTNACRANLPVADVMRMVMYRDYYRLPRLAREQWEEVGLDARLALQQCEACNACGQACPVGLAGAERVRETLNWLA